ncbi:MAG: CPBP family intramembrane metalloprotease [Alistipes sp.]|nr:CPBP family intramembrane metalloprotease [Alistipes sp.]
MRRLIFSLVVALLLWTLMFSPWTAPYFDFWTAMSGSAAILIGLATLFAPPWWRKLQLTRENLVLGLGIALVLWGVFWVGDKASSWLFDFAREQVDSIYGIKGETSPWVLSLLLLLLIGPAEEIFWRGYVQDRLSAKWGPNRGFLLATAAYTLVHLPSGNFMLVMASMVCGLAWGGLYRVMPQRFAAILISHAVWDAAVFVWFPIM